MADAAHPPPTVRAFCLSCAPADADRFLARMAELSRILFAANAQFNLTRIRPGGDFWVRHVADSLAAGRLLPELRTETIRLVDLGCGAGFPALVLAAAYPNLTVTALDSTRRKAEFVAAAARTLGLGNCSAVAGRGREHAVRHRGEADLVTARAVGDAADLCREAHALLRPGGRLVLYKTPDNAAREMEAARGRSPGKAYSWRITPPCVLPEQDITRVLLVGERPS